MGVVKIDHAQNNPRSGQPLKKVFNKLPLIKPQGVEAACCECQTACSGRSLERRFCTI